MSERAGIVDENGHFEYPVNFPVARFYNGKPHMKIVVISLERAVERRRRIVSDLNALGLDFELRDAVDGRNIPADCEALIDRAGSRRDGRPIRMGSIANWLSQRQALLDMVENGPEIMTVLEDDVEFAPEFPAVVDALDNCSEPFGIVFLHHGPRRPFVAHARLETGHRLGWVRWSHFGSQGYVITRDAARRFLETTPMVRTGIDRALARYWHHGLTTYCLRPAVVHQREEFAGSASLIRQAPVTEWSGPSSWARRRWFYVKEGVRKRVAFCRVLRRARGLEGAVRRG